jgi:pre-rRNA-processing protein IPI1
MDAISSIKEIFNSNFEFVSGEIGILLENACPLFINRDYKIREASIVLFKTILTTPKIKDKTIFIPFYELIDVHLSCAMTHLVEKIKYSSLKLLDILIEHLPDFLIAKPYKIFENFLDQISVESALSKKRTLKNDPCKFTSTQNWRYNVLKRMHTMMNIFFQKVNDSQVKEDKIDKSFQNLCYMDGSSKCKIYSKSQDEFYFSR